MAQDLLTQLEIKFSSTLKCEDFCSRYSGFLKAFFPEPISDSYTTSDKPSSIRFQYSNVVDAYTFYIPSRDKNNNVTRSGLTALLRLEPIKAELEASAPSLPYAKSILRIPAFFINIKEQNLLEWADAVENVFLSKIFDCAAQHRSSIIEIVFSEKQHINYRLESKLADFGFNRDYNSQLPGQVYVKQIKISYQDLKDFPARAKRCFPAISATPKTRKFILGIHHSLHNRLFPEFLLSHQRGKQYLPLADRRWSCRERAVIISFIHKTSLLEPGDIVVTYRKFEGYDADDGILTAIGVVQETRTRRSFSSSESFIAYINQGRQDYDEELLKRWYEERMPLTAITLYCSLPMMRRVSRQDLLEDLSLDLSPKTYFGFFELKNLQFDAIVNKGGLKDHSFLVMSNDIQSGDRS